MKGFVTISIKDLIEAINSVPKPTKKDSERQILVTDKNTGKLHNIRVEKYGNMWMPCTPWL